MDGVSAGQYEALMLALSERLHEEGKLLTAAVLSGATADGNIYYDAAAHTNAVLNAVDFINVMAYDGVTGSAIPSISLPWTVEPTGRKRGGCRHTKLCWAFPFMQDQAGQVMGRFWRACRMPLTKTMLPTMAWRSTITA